MLRFPKSKLKSDPHLRLLGALVPLRQRGLQPLEVLLLPGLVRPLLGPQLLGLLLRRGQALTLLLAKALDLIELLLVLGGLERREREYF